MILCIIGYYGKNFGDLLMLQGILNHLPADCNKVNILSYDQLDLIPLGINTKAKIVVYSIRMPLIKRIKVFKESDRIMWGGGSCFNDLNGTGAVKQMLLAKFVNPRIKIEYYGVGIDIKNNRINRLYLYTALCISSRFAVRDQKSYDMIKNRSNTELVEDPIYINKEWFESVKSKDRKKTLLISYRCVDKYYPSKHGHYIHNFLKNIKSLINSENFDNIIIIDADSNVDGPNNKYIFNSLVHETDLKVSYGHNLSLSEICLLLSSCTLVITGRLHLGAVATMYHTPCLLLNYSEKNLQFALNHNEAMLVEYEDLKVSSFLIQKYKQIH